MPTKLDFTKHLLAQLSDPPGLEEAIETWWYDYRGLGGLGLRLSVQGFKAFESAGIENYEFALSRRPYPKDLLTLARKLTCPYFINSHRQKITILLYGSREATMYALYGDFDRFIKNVSR